MKDHPLTPMRDSNLMRLLAPQVTQAGRAGRPADGGAGAPRRCATDWRRCAGRGRGACGCRCGGRCRSGGHRRRPAADMPLMTGGSARRHAPARALSRDGAAGGRRAARRGRCPRRPGAGAVGQLLGHDPRAGRGLCTAAAPAFRLDPLALAETGPGAALDWLAAQTRDATPLIYATADPDAVRAAQDKLGRARAGEMVEAGAGRARRRRPRRRARGASSWQGAKPRAR